MTSKICTSCNGDKILSCFYRNKNMKDVLSYHCKDCSKLTAQNNKIKDNQLRQKRYNADPEKFNQQSKKSHAKHRTKRLDKQKAYYQNNKEFCNIKDKIFREKNADSILLRNRQRKLLLKSFPIIKQSEVNAMLSAHDNKCLYCGVEVKRGINLHLDHKVPLCRGGKHTIDNLNPACQECNLRKGTKTVEEFMGNKC